MKTIIAQNQHFKVSRAICLVLAVTATFYAPKTNAVNLRIEPDVFGPEGEHYINNNSNIDMAQIGIDITKHGHSDTNKRCESGQLITFGWTGELEDGQVVTDSLQEFGKDVTLAVGQDNTYKCLELAVQQLHAGDHATVTCPAHLVFGNNNELSPLNGEVIPKNSKVIFNVRISDCNFIPQKVKYGQQPRTTTMQPEQCFYLKLVESDNTRYDLVLAARDEDESSEWPAKRVYFEQKVVDDEAQQWIYSEKTGAIKSVAYSQYTLAAYQGWLWAANVKASGAASDFPKSVQKWFFDDRTSALTSMIGGIEHQISIWGQPKIWAWAEVATKDELQDAAGNKFRIEYC